MTELRIRNIDEWIVDMHRHNAKRNGTSLEAELRRVLTHAALAKRYAMADRLEKNRDELRKTYGEFPSSAPFIRAIREGRL